MLAVGGNALYTSNAGGVRERAGVSKAAGGKALAVQYRCSKVSNVVDEGGCWWSGGHVLWCSWC
jgi:hypothetical protein